jgi:integrase
MLRKTWGYMARKYRGTPIELIQEKLGHASPAVTRRYIGITSDEIENVDLVARPL